MPDFKDKWKSLQLSAAQHMEDLSNIIFQLKVSSSWKQQDEDGLLLNNKLKTHLDVVFRQPSPLEGLISLERYFPKQCKSYWVNKNPHRPSGTRKTEVDKLSADLGVGWSIGVREGS